MYHEYITSLLQQPLSVHYITLAFIYEPTRNVPVPVTQQFQHNPKSIWSITIKTLARGNAN